MLQRLRTPYDKGLAEANPLIFMGRQEQNLTLESPQYLDQVCFKT